MSDGSLFIVDSLLEDLQNVTNCQFDMPIDDIINQIKEIYGEMMFARAFLKNIEVEQETYKDDVKESFVEIRDVAYEAEYLVNSYVVRNIPIWYMNLRLPPVIQKMKLIRARLQENKKIYDMKVIKVEENLNRKLSFKAVETHLDDNVFVGFEKIKILGDLTGGSEKCQIISIFGLAGLGKTTMAKKLYNDRLSYDYFDEHAWCVVSQTYQKINFLIGIFMSFTLRKSEKTAKDKIVKMEDESLGLEIHKRLKGRRYLIILDDVWHLNMRDDLKRYFPDDANGSRIILTSRIKDTAPIGSIFHPLHLLSEVQCWELLERKVFLEKPCPPLLLDIGKEIAAKCRGLPLAVVIIAGILAKSEKEENVWIKVERNLDSYIFDDPSGCLKTLELSYDYLPNHLRHAFSILGHSAKMQRSEYES